MAMIIDRRRELIEQLKRQGGPWLEAMKNWVRERERASRGAPFGSDDARLNIAWNSHDWRLQMSPTSNELADLCAHVALAVAENTASALKMASDALDACPGRAPKPVSLIERASADLTAACDREVLGSINGIAKSTDEKSLREREVKARERQAQALMLMALLRARNDGWKMDEQVKRVLNEIIAS